MVTELEKRKRNTVQKIHKSQTRTQHFHQQVNEIVPSDESYFIDPSMVFRLGMFLTIHVSAVIEIGITDQGNWMYHSAGGDVIFVVS